MPVDVRGRRLEGLSTAGRWVFRGVFAVLFVAAIAINSHEMSSANRDAARAAAFAAAPSCPPATVPVGDCIGWEQETVSGINVGRGGTTIRLSAGGQQLFLGDHTGWASRLAAGSSVSVLVWRNQAQALREPTGEVLYGNDYVPFKRYTDIAFAVCPFGAVAVFYVWLGSLDAPPLRLRRPRLWFSLNALIASVGVGFLAGGATTGQAQSVDWGLTAGVIAFLVALATTGFVARVRRRRLQRAGAFAR